MSEIITFRPKPAPTQDEVDQMLHKLIAVAAIAERTEAAALTGQAVSPTNQLQVEFQQAAMHLRRAYRIAVDAITQPPKGAA